MNLKDHIEHHTANLRRLYLHYGSIADRHLSNRDGDLLAGTVAQRAAIDFGRMVESAEYLANHCYSIGGDEGELVQQAEATGPVDNAGGEA